jgi:DNA-directed RNA polymerase subunit RPC12/RpoP
MNRVGDWFKNLWKNIGIGISRFMQGRYGMDKLSSMLLWVSVGLAVVGMFFPGVVGLVFTLLAYVLMGIAIFRALSRNVYKRYEENRKFLLFFQKLKDKEHRYYNCPRCHQQVRVPKGKGKISITCPKCREKFIKTT